MCGRGRGQGKEKARKESGRVQRPRDERKGRQDEVGQRQGMRKTQIKTFQSGQILMMWGGEVREREVSRLILQVSGMAAWVEGGYF